MVAWSFHVTWVFLWCHFLHRHLRAAKRQRTAKDPASNEHLDGPSPSLEDQCNQTSTHPLHISITLPPKPIYQWPALQNPEDIPKDVPRIPPDEIRESLPKDLIVLRDEKARHRILVVPACPRVALTKTEHETMIHVKGNRVHHELSRLYYWPQMKTLILDICSACSTCQESQVRRQNLPAEFRQADIKFRQADFYIHEQGKILVAVDLCTREATLWFLANRKQDSVARALLSLWAHPPKGCPPIISQR
jgi:hypothetical protein